tara:strand:- start:2909 stop:3484 length:576 start_codon:yes stop_codon:yes gene_type:complete
MENNINNDQQSFNFWFENEEFNDHDQFGEKYYVNTFYKDIVPSLNIPDYGYIVVMGTARAVSFNVLCEIFGPERCIGYDLYNPSNHPRVKVKDCNLLSEQDNIPIAFAHNDIGSIPHTPELKYKTQIWLLNNIIKGGYLLGNNNLNRAKFKFEELAVEKGFINTQFSELNKKLIKNLPFERIEGYMYSKKK